MSGYAPYDWQVLEASAESPAHITTAQELAEHCRYWKELPYIALDTEFQRIDTFYPIPGLIQIADDKQCYLVDPTTIDDFSALAELFADRSVLKIMHASSEDLELFQKMIGTLPTPLFDTQVAGGLLGWGFSVGLQRMLEERLSVTLAKHETTSDWLQRPLTASQEKYAALDVAYLPAIYQTQAESLACGGKLSWLEQEAEALLRTAQVDDADGLLYYIRFTQMWRLPPHKLAALRDLTAWREQEARKRDVPRNRILRNQTILLIIEKWPQTMTELSRLKEIKRSVLRTDGEVILALLGGGKESAERVMPEPIPQPLHASWNKHLKKLKTIARDIALEQNIAPEILLRRKELEQLMRSGIETGEYRFPETLSSWRKALLEPLLLKELDRIEKLRTQGS